MLHRNDATNQPNARGKTWQNEDPKRYKLH